MIGFVSWHSQKLPHVVAAVDEDPVVTDTGVWLQVTILNGMGVSGKIVDRVSCPYLFIITTAKMVLIRMICDKDDDAIYQDIAIMALTYLSSDNVALLLLLLLLVL